MQVIKRDGRVEELNLEKLIVAIERASDDAHRPLNESDAEHLVRSIGNTIKSQGKDKISVFDIREIVVAELVKWGFGEIAKFYEEGRR